MMNGVPFLAATITLTALSTPLYFSKGFNFRSTLRLFPFDRCEAMKMWWCSGEHTVQQKVA